MAACPTCGHKPRAKTAGRKRPPAISFGGRNHPNQAAWYAENMRVKRGELVWCVLEHADRFGARGDYVTPDRAVELREHAALMASAPMSLVEARLREEEAGYRPRTLIAAHVTCRAAA